jgi:putative DNA methylase
MQNQMIAIAAEGQRGRVYIEPSTEDERAAAGAKPQGIPDSILPAQAVLV